MPVRPSANLALLSLLATPSLPQTLHTKDCSHRASLSLPPFLLHSRPHVAPHLNAQVVTRAPDTPVRPSANLALRSLLSTPSHALVRPSPKILAHLSHSQPLSLWHRPHPPIHDVAEHSHCRTPTLPPVPFAPTHPFTAPLSSVSSHLTTWILPTICRRAPKLRTASVHHG